MRGWLCSVLEFRLPALRAAPSDVSRAHLHLARLLLPQRLPLRRRWLGVSAQAVFLAHTHTLYSSKICAIVHPITRTSPPTPTPTPTPPPTMDINQPPDKPNGPSKDQLIAEIYTSAGTRPEHKQCLSA